MKKIVVILLFIFCCYTNVNSQTRDSIIYIFPDKVEHKLFQYIQNDNKHRDCPYSFFLETEGVDAYRVFVSCNAKESENFWVKNTNRFVIIKDKFYPLVVDYDSLFSTNKPNEIGKYGRREGFVWRTYFLNEGYNLSFDRYGKKVKEDWGIYKKEN